MFAFVAQRLTGAVWVVLGASVLVFLMIHLIPGDPVQVMLGETGHTQEQVDRARANLGLDKPIHRQYLSFLTGALTGDMGDSFHMRKPVVEAIGEQFGATIVLAVSGMIIAIVVGVFLGVVSAVRHGTWLDGASMFLALIGVSIPNFWLGLMLIMVFSFQLGWFPATGTHGVERLVLPALTLGLSAAGLIARMVRASVLDVLQQDFVRTAHAKGLRRQVVTYKHTLRNAMIPALTIIGLQFGYLIGGSMVIEIVFSRQGIGRLAVTAILQKDYPLIQGVILLSAVSFIVVNLLVDFSYSLLDPRIRYA